MKNFLSSVILTRHFCVVEIQLIFKFCQIFAGKWDSIYMVCLFITIYDRINDSIIQREESAEKQHQGKFLWCVKNDVREKGNTKIHHKKAKNNKNKILN